MYFPIIRPLLVSLSNVLSCQGPKSTVAIEKMKREESVQNERTGKNKKVFDIFVQSISACYIFFIVALNGFLKISLSTWFLR